MTKGTLGRLALAGAVALLMPAAARADLTPQLPPLPAPVPLPMVSTPTAPAALTPEPANVAVAVTTQVGTPSPAQIRQTVIAAKKACQTRTRRKCRVVTRTLQSTLQAKEVVVEKAEAFTGFNACPGIDEAIALEGHTRVAMHLVVDSSGGIHLVTTTLESHGTGFGLGNLAAGLPAGNKYTWYERQWQELNFPEPTLEVSFDWRIRATRAGESVKADDFFFRTRLHFTFPHGPSQPPSASFFVPPGFECR